MTGVQPRRVQVARRLGIRLMRLSSWKTIHAPLARALCFPRASAFTQRSVAASLHSTARRAGRGAS